MSVAGPFCWGSPHCGRGRTTLGRAAGRNSGHSQLDTCHYTHLGHIHHHAPRHHHTPATACTHVSLNTYPHWPHHLYTPQFPSCYKWHAASTRERLLLQKKKKKIAKHGQTWAVKTDTTCLGPLMIFLSCTAVATCYSHSAGTAHPTAFMPAFSLSCHLICPHHTPSLDLPPPSILHFPTLYLHGLWDHLTCYASSVTCPLLIAASPRYNAIWLIYLSPYNRRSAACVCSRNLSQTRAIGKRNALCIASRETLTVAHRPSRRQRTDHQTITRITSCRYTPSDGCARDTLATLLFSLHP